MDENPHISGVLPVLHMPFRDDGAVDFRILAREIDHVIEAGCDGVVLALASELMRLDRTERLELTECIPEMVTDRCTVTISVGAETTRDAVGYARAAERAGADAVMAVPPIATRLPESQVFAYYRAIHDSVSLPLVVQDASGYLGHCLSVDIQARLRTELGPRVYFKPESSPVGPTITALHRALGGRGVVFEGSGGLQLVESYRRGISGTMPGSDLVRGIVEIWRALVRGDDARAYAVYLPLCAIVTLESSSLDAYLSIEKHLLMNQGVFENRSLRAPWAYELDSFTAAEVDRLYAIFLDALG
jgi:dihydrodipicolinate synthase/N-acetylneuraminate lyase